MTAEKMMELADTIEYAIRTEGGVMLFKERGDLVVAALRSSAVGAGAQEALEHALVRFECLQDHFQTFGDEALWAMSSVDADRMRKGLASLQSQPAL